MVFFPCRLTPYLENKVSGNILPYILEDFSFRKIEAWNSFCNFNSHVCGQENWFQNWSTEDFSVNNHWTPTLSIARDILHDVRNLLY